MKKKMIGIAAVMLAMLLVLTACGSRIEGTWNLTDIQYPGVTGTGGLDMKTALATGIVGMQMTLKDGVMSVNVTGMLASLIQGDSGSGIINGGGKYQISGNQLTVTNQNDEKVTVEYSVNGDTLELKADSGTLVFTRQK
ncbi:MAG: lipocalin family protein [Clostridia bacterium]|nr:lipocalin family protein [Clostridia bacterium]